MRNKGLIHDITYCLSDTVITDPETGSQHKLDSRHTVTKEELDNAVRKIEESGIKQILTDIYEKKDTQNYGFDEPYGVFNSPYDSGLRTSIDNILQSFKKDGIKIRDVIHCGIGGSELGASAAISALSTSKINYYPITSLNNDHLAEIKNKIEPSHTLLIMASRSGTTKETLTAYEVFKSYLGEHLNNEELPKHIVHIVGEGKIKDATDRGYHTLKIEGKMSGRYTVLHSANLFTMALAGVDINQLHEGARDMYERCINANTIDNNPALQIAAIEYVLANAKPQENQKNILVTSVFSPKLTKYGGWRDQLTEESLGHREDIFLSTKTIELSDKAHSNFQNLVAGANRYLHQFVVPLNSEYAPILSGTNPSNPNESVGEVEMSAYFGIRDALASKDRPSFTTYLPSINAFAMGQLFMRDMLRTVYLGELLGLRTEKGVDGIGYFDQPGVTIYKNIMNHYLNNPDNLQSRLAEILAKITNPAR